MTDPIFLEWVLLRTGVPCGGYQDTSGVNILASFLAHFELPISILNCA